MRDSYLIEPLTPEVEILDALPSAGELRHSMGDDVGRAGRKPVSRLVDALESAERDGRTAYLISVNGRDSAPMHTLIDSMLPDRPPQVPSQAKVLQARRNAEARLELLREFGYLTAEQIAEGRSKAANRSALAGRWRKEGRIIGVEWKGRNLFPGFQFDEQGAPLPAVADVLGALPRDRMSDWEVALWFTAANGWLSGARPVDLLTADKAAAIAGAAAQLAEPSPL
jgi:hypothetical protein